jgi:hypothetical protein
MLPRVVLHNAASVDGRFDWFTPDIGRFYELASRWREDATPRNRHDTRRKEPTQTNRQDPPRDELTTTLYCLSFPIAEDAFGLVACEGSRLRDTIALCSRSTPETP